MNEFLETVPFWLPEFGVMLGLVAASAFFSGSETSLFYLSHEEQRNFRSGNSSERAAARLLAEPDRLLTAVLFWNLLVNLSYFAVSVAASHRLASAGHQAAAGIFGIASLAGIILLGEVLPKGLAVVAPKRLAPLVSWPLAITVRALDPITPVLRQVAKLTRRTIWPHLQREPILDTEDLEHVVETEVAGAEMIRTHRRLLRNVLELSEVKVEELMRPRGTYVTMAPPVGLNSLRSEVPPGDYLLLVEPGTQDVYAAVALTEFSVVPDKHLEEAAEEVVFVPWCAPAGSTLQRLREYGCGVAVVVSEHGDEIGIVTYEDLIESVLVPQSTRTFRVLSREPVKQLGPDRFQVEGLTTLRYLSRRLGLEFEPDEHDQVTVFGMLSAQLERIPEVGDVCDWHGYRIEVVEVLDLGDIRAIITPAQDAAADASQQDAT